MSYNHHLNAPVVVRVPRQHWEYEQFMDTLGAGFTYDTVEYERGQASLIHIISLPKTSERDGLAGLEVWLKALAMWVVPGEYSVTDEHNQTLTITF